MQHFSHYSFRNRTYFSALFEVVNVNFSEVVNYAKSGPSRAVWNWKSCFYHFFAILVNLAVNLVTQPSKMRRGGGNWLTRVQHQTLRTSNYLNFLISFNWTASNACWSNVAYSLKAFAYRTIVIEPFKNKLRTGWPPETTWAPAARCAKSGTNGQAVVRSLQNFHECFRKCLKSQINIYLRQKLVFTKVLNIT